MKMSVKLHPRSGEEAPPGKGWFCKHCNKKAAYCSEQLKHKIVLETHAQCKKLANMATYKEEEAIRRQKRKQLEKA